MQVLLEARVQTHQKSPTSLTALESAEAAGHHNVIHAFRDFQRREQSMSRPGQLQVGLKVVLHRIVTKPDLNGKAGTVVEVMNDTWLLIRLDGVIEPMSLKRQHMKLQPAVSSEPSRPRCNKILRCNTF